MWASSQKCPMFYLLRVSGRVGEVERPLFRSFVYVRSGSGVLGEQRSLGMLGHYSSYAHLWYALYIVDLHRRWDTSGLGL